MRIELTTDRAGKREDPQVGEDHYFVQRRGAIVNLPDAEAQRLIENHMARPAPEAAVQRPAPETAVKPTPTTRAGREPRGTRRPSQGERK